MYKLVKDEISGEVRSVLRDNENLHIPFDPANTDYQEYCRWLAEGNKPIPADEGEQP